MSVAKRALCIGSNDYPGTDGDLSGCVNDAHDERDEVVVSVRHGAVTRFGDLAADAESSQNWVRFLPPSCFWPARQLPTNA